MTANPLDATLGADRRDRPLRLALRLDAAASGAMGLLLAAGGAFLEDPFGIRRRCWCRSAGSWSSTRPR